jgi:hypothetical protein
VGPSFLEENALISLRLFIEQHHHFFFPPQSSRGVEHGISSPQGWGARGALGHEFPGPTSIARLSRQVRKQNELIQFGQEADQKLFRGFDALPASIYAQLVC